MINALSSLGKNQFEFAKWFMNEEKTRFKQIQVAIVSEREKKFNTVIQNLIVDDDTTVLKTNYAYDYKIRQIIEYRGKFWIITQIGEKTMDINPQALALLSANVNKLMYLSLMRVDE